MNAAIYFTVPDSMDVAAQRCLKAVKQLGAPLKSDSGHFITGVIKSGLYNVDVRVTWLAAQGGTQITVTTSHDALDEYALRNVAQYFQDEYINKTNMKRKPALWMVVSSVMVIGSALAAIAMYLMAASKHK